MRVCLLTPILDAFKGGNHLPLLAAMPDTEFVILTNRCKPEHPDLPPNVAVQTVPARVGPYYYGFYDYLFARSVLQKYPVDDPYWRQFDLIHLNQTMGPAFLRLQGAHVPMCLLIHHPVSADLDVAVQESGFFEGLRWRLKYLALVSFQQRFCRTLPHLITVSKTAAKRIAADYGCEEAKIRIVPNGVDTSEFTPGDLSAADFDVIAVGAFIHPRKGFSHLLQTYERLAEKGLRIADVGRRSQEQQDALRTIPGVRMFGMVGQDELVSLMRRSATLVSTSLYEGFGLSLIEALSCGRPAFAFDAGAVREVLDPVDPTLTVPLRDTGALVSRVTAFLALPAEERVRKGEEYRAAVLRLYPLSASANALTAEYRAIVRKGGVG